MNRRLAIGRIICVVLLAFMFVCHGAAVAKSFPEALGVIEARVATNLTPKVPGLSVALGRDEKIVWTAGFGFADLEKRKPATSRTLFRIGSVSKPLTAAGMMLLVEQGRLDLDADIRKYLPDFPDKGEVITTRQLAGHLAGIRHYRSTEFLMNKPFATVRESLKIFENDPLLFKPGEKYSYSSYGYNLLSSAMESAAKEEFLAYMDKSVFLPLKMTNTMPDRAKAELPERTRFYDAKPGGGFVVAATVDNSYKWAGGGFLSTPEDLVRFGFALMKPGFLKRESLATMFKSQTTSDGKPTGYGVGWSIRRNPGHRIFMHTGGSVGGTSVLMLFPDSRVVLAMTANCTASPFDKTNLDAFSAEFSGPFTQP
jgi:serine beta-lactamase-like protein LACTB, mitochondrial